MFSKEDEDLLKNLSPNIRNQTFMQRQKEKRKRRNRKNKSEKKNNNKIYRL